MNTRRYSLPIALAALLLAAVGARADVDANSVADARYIHDWNRVMTDIILEDGFSPPAASRIYTYANIAAYEAARPGFPMCVTLAGQVNGLREPPKPNSDCRHDWRIAAIAAYRKVASLTLYRTFISDSLYEAQIAELAASGVPHDVIKCSADYGEAVGAHVLAWSREDGFVKIQAGEKYVIPKVENGWAPTPPDFKEPIDPFWHTIRPFTLESATQYAPDPPNPFSSDTASAFYKEALEVYHASKNLSQEQRIIAQFWDCNPMRSNHYGHLMWASRQISPGGHWICITTIAARKANATMIQSLEAYTLVSMALADAFITCWTEKYRSNVIRPVTYIQRYIDSNWTPLLQTPPFPEHSSGHSTISAASAVILTHLFGPMSYDDDTEVRFGLPVRSFPSFMAAAEEAAVSRLYGGIHYRRAATVGTDNGKKIGEHIIRKIKMRQS